MAYNPLIGFLLRQQPVLSGRFLSEIPKYIPQLLKTLTLDVGVSFYYRGAAAKTTKFYEKRFY
jgi:hypothetical protein